MLRGIFYLYFPTLGILSEGSGRPPRLAVVSQSPKRRSIPGTACASLGPWSTTRQLSVTAVVQSLGLAAQPSSFRQGGCVDGTR